MVETLGILLIACVHLDHREHLREAAQWLRDRLSCDGALSPESHALALFHIARDEVERGNYTLARRTVSKATVQTDGPVSAWTASYIEMLRAKIEIREGNLDAAARLALHGASIAETTGSDALLADALTMLGVAAAFQHKHDSAQRICARAATCYWRAGDAVGRSSALVNRASALLLLGRLNDSGEVFREAQRAASSVGRQITVLRARLGLGWIAARKGNAKRARKYLLPAWREARRQRVPREEALALEYLSEAYLLSDNLAKARVAVKLCSRLAERLAPEGDIALEIKIKEAMLFLAEGDARAALTSAREAVQHAQRVGMPWEEAQAHRMVGTALLYAGGKKMRARQAFERAQKLLEAMGEQLERPVVEAWLKALEKRAPRRNHQYGSVANDGGVGAVVLGTGQGFDAGRWSAATQDPDAPQDPVSEAVGFWLDHPLLGPNAWLRERSAPRMTSRIASHDSAAASVSTATTGSSELKTPMPVESPAERAGLFNANAATAGSGFTAGTSDVLSPSEIRNARYSSRSADPSHSPDRRPLDPIWNHLDLLTRTTRVIEVLRLTETYAQGTIPVMILGETGTGKDLIAQALHTLSGRSGRFVPVNCAAAHRELFVAELFGARRGAYTGAAEHREGLIREAEGGTLFLDEIADLDPEAQGFLLRFLDSGEVRPLGDARSGGDMPGSRATCGAGPAAAGSVCAAGGSDSADSPAARAA
jgi:tetratricopeptide (TPR) repeat protein